MSYNLPAERWIHRRATDAIESIFAADRLSPKVTRAGAVAMVSTLGRSAQVAA